MRLDLFNRPGVIYNSKIPREFQPLGTLLSELLPGEPVFVVKETLALEGFTTQTGEIEATWSFTGELPNAVNLAYHDLGELLAP